MSSTDESTPAPTKQRKPMKSDSLLSTGNLTMTTEKEQQHLEQQRKNVSLVSAISKTMGRDYRSTDQIFVKHGSMDIEVHKDQLKRMEEKLYTSILLSQLRKLSAT